MLRSTHRMATGRTDWRLRNCGLLFVAMIGIASAARGQGKFRIDIVVENLTNPAKVIMTVRDRGNWVEYTAESKGENFILTGSVAEPSFAYLVLKYNSELTRGPRMANVTQLYVDNVNIGINTKDSLRAAVIKGPREQQDLEVLEAITGKRAKPSESANALRRTAIAGFVAKHTDSYVSIYALQNMAMDAPFAIEADQVEPSYNLLTSRIRNSLSGRELGKDIERSKATAIGAVAPDFSQKDTLGYDVKLSSLRGRYVLIDFWASWCKPCRAENPTLVKTFNAYKYRNFTVVGVSLDNNRKSWIKAINKDKLAWTHVSDLKFWRNEVAQLYGVKTVPQNYLLDPSGKIIARNININQLASELAKVLPSR